MTQQIGETREAMGWGFMERLQEALDMHSKEDEYYILVHTKPLRGQTLIGATTTFKEVFLKMKTCPPAMIGTIRIFVNNRKGTYKLEVFPHDVPIDESVYSDNEFSTDVAETAFKVGHALIYQ